MKYGDSGINIILKILVWYLDGFGVNYSTLTLGKVLCINQEMH
jgi:hypothetical protein